MSVTETTNAKTMRIINAIKPLIVQAVENSNRTCINCEHWYPVEELCGYKAAMQRPPAVIIVKGCAVWRATVPF